MFVPAAPLDADQRFEVHPRDARVAGPFLLSSNDLRRAAESAGATQAEPLRLSLGYRPPFGWKAILRILRRHAMPGVEVVGSHRYSRIIQIGAQRGVLRVEDSLSITRLALPHLQLEVSPALAPHLTTLAASVRHLFDLEADPRAIDRHLSAGGLGHLVEHSPGLRLPGAMQGFEVALAVLLPPRLRARVVARLGEPFATDTVGLTHLMPTAAHVADAGISRLMAMGVTQLRAETLVQVAQLVESGALRLSRGDDPHVTRRVLMEVGGISDRMATTIVMRALAWADAFPADDPGLVLASGQRDAASLLQRADAWRPWRAYGALHLWREPTSL